MSEKAKKKAAEEPTAEEKKNAAVAHATRNKRVLKALVSRLAGEGKMDRARAAEMVHEVACQTPERLIDHIPHLLDALDRPEPQTRWEVLGALEEMAPKFARMLDKAIVPATVSLHDADSGVVRVSAFRMLAAYGATSIRRSEKVWPLRSILACSPVSLPCSRARPLARYATRLRIWSSRMRGTRKPQSHGPRGESSR